MKATVNYVIPPEDGVVRFVLDTHWSGLNLDPRSVPITDARSLPAPATLDREGFTLTRVVSGVTDYSDSDQVEALHKPAAEEAIKAVTGASWATSFAWNVRFSNNSPKSTDTPIAAPARAIHADLRPSLELAKIDQEPMGESAARALRERWGDKLPKRWRMYNLWQMISSPPQDTPLAVCDLSSLVPEDILKSDGRDVEGSDKSYPVTFFRYNPDHRWYYYSNMLPGEAVVFSSLDREAEGHYGLVPHTGFDLPDAPSHSIPRNSIEIRVVAVFDDD